MALEKAEAYDWANRRKLTEPDTPRGFARFGDVLVSEEKLGHLMVLRDEMPVPFCAAGGYFVDAVLGRTPRDLDVFFGCESHWWDAVCWMKHVRAKLVNASPMSTKVHFGGIDVDLVCRAFYPHKLLQPHFYGVVDRRASLREVLKSFDFDACMIGWGPKEGYLPSWLDGQHTMGAATMSDIQTKVINLSPEAVRRPTSTLMHIGRYIAKGFKVSAAEVQVLADAKRSFEERGMPEDDWQS